MQLRDGGLYETKHGKRFRVTETGGVFECRSFSGRWDGSGQAYGQMWINDKYRKPHLIREVDESRWVPASREKWASTAPALRFTDGHKHHQVLVSRAEAKRIAQEGRDNAVLNSVMAAAMAAQPPVDSFATKIPEKGEGNISLKDKWNFSVGFTWAISNDGKHSVLDIETTSGGKATFRL